MARFRLGDTQVEISLFFCAFFCIASAASPTAAVWLLLMLLHESGHLLMMALAGDRPRSVCFRMGRMTIVPGEGTLAPGDEAGILLGGVAMNLLVGAAAGLLGARPLLDANLMMTLFNLLPVTGLDGGGLLLLATRKEGLVRALSAITGMGLILLTGVTLFSGRVGANPVLALVGGLFLFRALQSGRQTMLHKGREA